MAKELRCDVKKLYGKVDCNEQSETHLVELSWNGRDCNGVDIRKFDTKQEMYLKGIKVSYQGLTDLLLIAVENGLISPDDIKDSMKKWTDKTYDDEDFDELFDKFHKEVENYKRDKHGNLVSKDGAVFIIPSRFDK